MLHDEKLRSVI